MSDLRTNLERLGERARPGQDAFERLERRRRRKTRNRRLGAGVLALLLTVGGSLAAFSAFRDAGDDQTIGGGRPEGFFALWPEQTEAGLAAAQEGVDAGDPELAWRADPLQVAERFATEQLLWPEVAVALQDGSNAETDEVIFYDLESVGESCPLRADPADCSASTVSLVLERLGSAGGLWSVTEVHSEDLVLPLVTGEEVAAGTTISVPTNLPDGEKVSIGVAFLSACDAAGVDENLEAGGGMLEFQVPAVSDGCTGYVYAMLPKTGVGAVAIGSFLFTDARDVPGIGYFVEAISAVPVRFASDTAAEVVELTCDGTGTISPTRSVVTAQPDGVHIAVTNTGNVPVSFSIEGVGGDGAEPGERKETVWQIPPGNAVVSCSVITDGGSGVASSASLDVVDPSGSYVPSELECAGGEAYGQAADYVEGTTGSSGDPVQVARDHVSGLEFDDAVERASYPESEEPVIRVVRGGAVVGKVTFINDGSGGWLVNTIEGCGGTQFGWSDEPAGMTGSPGDPGSALLSLCDAESLSNDVNIHDGADLHVDGQNIDFDTNCLMAPAGERITILFSNLDEGVPRNISIYAMTPCLADALVAGTAPGCPSVGFPLAGSFTGEIIVGVSEIVYELGRLEPGNYYFQDDIHPTIANGVLFVQ